MKIRALDSNSDWKWGKGLQSYNYDAAAISENIKTRLNCWLNDCWFDMNAGLDWARLLGSKNVQTEIELSVRAIILQTEGVLKCNKVSVNIYGDTRNLVLSYSIDTIFSKNVSDTTGV